MGRVRESDLAGLVHRLRTEHKTSGTLNGVVSLAELDALETLGLSIQIDPHWPDPGRQRVAIDLTSLTVLRSHKGNWFLTDASWDITDETPVHIGPLLVLDQGERHASTTRDSAAVQ